MIISSNLDYFGCFTYTIMSSANYDCSTHSFPVFMTYLFFSHDLGLSLRCWIKIVRVEIYALSLILAKRHPVFYSISCKFGGSRYLLSTWESFLSNLLGIFFLTYTAAEFFHLLTSTEMIIYFSLSMYLSSSYWMMYAKNSDACRSVDLFFIPVYFFCFISFEATLDAYIIRIVTHF